MGQTIDAVARQAAAAALYAEVAMTLAALLVVALVLHALFARSARRDVVARLELLEHRAALPELRRDVDSWTERVAESSREANQLAQQSANGQPPRVHGLHSGFEIH